MNDHSFPPLYDVDIKHLKLFKVVVECGGLSAAEELSGLGVSAISRQLSDLEARLGTPLCRRGRGGFQLTREGEVAYRATLRLLDSIDEFRGAIAGVKGEVGGELTVWLIDHCISPVDSPLSAAFRGFCADHPKVWLSVNVAAPDAVERGVSERKAALGVTICKSDLPELSYQVLGSEESSMYCGRGHPAFGADEEAARALLVRTPGWVRRGYLVHDKLAETLPAAGSAVAYHVEATVLLLLTGAYVGIVPDRIAQPWVEVGQLRRLQLPDFHTQRPLFLVTRVGRSRSRAADLMCERIVSSFAAMTGV